MSQLRLRADALAWREVGDEVIAIDLRRSLYLSLNGSGTLLWRAMAGGSTRAGLVRLLREEFGLDEEQAAGDVDAFIVELADQDLLDEASP